MKLDHVAIVVKNPKEAAQWYVNHFSASVEYLDETWAMLKLGDCKLALTVANQHPPHVAFEISDFSSFTDRVCKKHRDGSDYLYISDPDGNIIELIRYP